MVAIGGSELPRDDTCWIGRQAMIAFSGCLCGITSSLLISSIPFISLLISCGIALTSLDNISARHLGSKQFFISFAVTFVTVWSICFLFLDVHDFSTVVFSSISSAVAVSVWKTWLHCRLLGAELVPVVGQESGRSAEKCRSCSIV